MMIRNVAICMALLGGTVACGPLNKGGMTARAVETVSVMTGLRKAAPPAPPAIPTAALAAGPGNVLMVTLLGRGAVAPLTRVGENNGVVTWRTAKGVTLSFQDDILTASRGLNEDLMGADVDGVAAAIRAGTGTTQRVHSFLDSEDQIKARALTCTVTKIGPETITTVAGPSEAIKVDETCDGSALQFTNNYWLDAIGGNIVQSQQVLAPSVGFIRVNPL